MKLTNAIKKIEKAGFELTKLSEQRYTATNSHSYIDFMSFNGGESVSCIKVAYKNDTDDLYSDYHAGVFASNIAQAIRLASN